jgi:outer membrane murein-binding lipoprotein Lpp
VPRMTVSNPTAQNSQRLFSVDSVSAPVRHRFSAAIACAIVGVTVLSGCSSIANVQAADDAGNPLCAEMMVLLPSEIADQQKRQTNSQATAVWGDPSQLVLRCGVTPPPPSTDPCVTVNGVDWLAKEGEKSWTLTTYGRTPATELIFDPNVTPSSTVLASLATAASKIPAQRHCTDVTKSEDIP